MVCLFAPSIPWVGYLSFKQIKYEHFHPNLNVPVRETVIISRAKQQQQSAGSVCRMKSEFYQAKASRV